MNHYFACAGEYNFNCPKTPSKKASWPAGKSATSAITKGRWSYARPPQVESTHVSRSTTKITLVSIGTDAPSARNSFPGGSGGLMHPPAPTPGPGKPIPAPSPYHRTRLADSRTLTQNSHLIFLAKVMPNFPSVTIPKISDSEDYTTLQAYVDIESVRYMQGYTRCGSTGAVNRRFTISVKD